MTGLKGFNKYGVAVAMECEHDVAVARAGEDVKPAHVISIKGEAGVRYIPLTPISTMAVSVLGRLSYSVLRSRGWGLHREL